MSETIKVNVYGETFERQVRRVRRLEDGTHVGWISFQGRDTKVRREKRKRIWSLAD